MKVSIYFVLLIFSLFYFSDLCQSKDIIVTTKNGKIKGKTVTFLNKTINQFTGIRFGKAPVGDLRFKKPIPVENWANVYDATKKGNACWQNLLPGLNYTPNFVNEDCLFLNIWTTSNLTNSNHRKPVMFFIHGGGFVMGTSVEEIFYGEGLALFDVVVVTINYRLGPFGFLYNSSESAPGNVGFHDQVLALKWTKDNIASFGGDPKNITIFGESAGSMSVGYHLISPLSKNLFKRAIMQSGSPYTYSGKVSNNSLSLEESKNFAKRMNCKENWLECLKKLPPNKLSNSTFAVFPIIGDDFNPIGPIKAMRTGKFNHIDELLSGVTENEGSSWARVMLEGSNLTKKELIKKIKVLNTFPIPKKPDDDEAIYNYYFSKNITDKDTLKKTFADIIGDSLLSCPTYLQSRDLTNYIKNSKVYLYRLRHKGKLTISGCNEKWMGVCHAEDLAFIFAFPFRFENSYTDADRQMSLLMMYYWSNFAKTGNPMSEKPPHNLKVSGIELWPKIDWPAYKTNGTAMNLNPYKIELIRQPFEKCDNFWNKYFN